MCSEEGNVFNVFASLQGYFLRSIECKQSCVCLQDNMYTGVSSTVHLNMLMGFVKSGGLAIKSIIIPILMSTPMMRNNANEQVAVLLAAQIIWFSCDTCQHHNLVTTL